MTTEDKDLLLKDLCARLPYGVHLFTNSKHHIRLLTISNDTDYDEQYWINGLYDIDEVKPYLRPMSSMTEDECITLSKLIPYETDAWKYIKTPIPLYIANIEQFDFFNSHHLDWRGLISKGLAIKVTEENNPYKEIKL